jgi:hypothetical protein
MWAVVDHRSVADSLAPFGPPNGHLIDDYAAASATIGVAFVLAAFKRAWRVPLLAVALTWTALHTASHVVAVDEATDVATGLAEAAVLAASTLLLGLLLRAATMQSARSDESRETASSR